MQVTDVHTSLPLATELNTSAEAHGAVDHVRGFGEAIICPVHGGHDLEGGVERALVRHLLPVQTVGCGVGG